MSKSATACATVYPLGLPDTTTCPVCGWGVAYHAGLDPESLAHVGKIMCDGEGGQVTFVEGRFKGSATFAQMRWAEEHGVRAASTAALPVSLTRPHPDAPRPVHPSWAAQRAREDRVADLLAQRDARRNGQVHAGTFPEDYSREAVARYNGDARDLLAQLARLEA